MLSAKAQGRSQGAFAMAEPNMGARALSGYLCVQTGDGKTLRHHSKGAGRELLRICT